MDKNLVSGQHPEDGRLCLSGDSHAGSDSRVAHGLGLETLVGGSIQEYGGAFVGISARDGHCKTAIPSDSGFSRHDSLFSFGVTPSRNAAELKSFLGSSNSRLKPGATVLPQTQSGTTGDHSASTHAVSLEQAKHRARVEVDISLENDCCVEGGYLRGSVKLRVRKRHRKEAHILLADGKLRVIGFECVSGETDRHVFYQRASPLTAVTDGYSRMYDSTADSEGFSRAMEGVHVLPFAMHLLPDSQLGSPRGSPCMLSGVSVRYIVMASVKVKDSRSGQRSIAHFYRDCQIWPRLDPSIVFTDAPRPIHASTAGSLSVIGAGRKVKLTAMLPRVTWLAGQRCYVHLSVANESKKPIKSIRLALVRTTTLFKPKASSDCGETSSSADTEVCQTSTSHKVISESVLERSQGAVKGHASTQGWWSGVPAGQEAQFAHYILIHPDALSFARARLAEVEYSIQVSISAGALAPDIRLALPIRVVNFLSLDPLPCVPLLAADGSYARVIPRDPSGAIEDPYDNMNGVEVGKQPRPTGLGNLGSPLARTEYDLRRHRPVVTPDCFPGNMPDGGVRTGVDVDDADPLPATTALHVTNPDSDLMDPELDSDASEDSQLAYASASDSSLYSTASFMSDTGTATSPLPMRERPPPAALPLGNFELPDGADVNDEVGAVLQSMSSEVPPDATAYTFRALEGPTPCSIRYAAPDGVSNVGAGAKPPSSPSSAPENPASGGSSSAPSGTHCRSAKTYRSHADPVQEVATRSRAVVSPDADTNLRAAELVFEASRPVRPERSPLRARTGTWGPRRPGTTEGNSGNGMTSFERRVREKKLALLHVQTGLLSPADHHREPAQRHMAPSSLDDGSDDGDDTPKLRSSGGAQLGPSRSTNVQHDSGYDTAGSRTRGSRQLPVPPPRASHIVPAINGTSHADLDIPPSVSALEALRASQLCGRGELPRRSTDATDIPPAMPPPLVPSTSSSSSSGRSSSPHERHSAVASSMSGLGLHRPTEGLQSTGSSEASMVKGRIAAFEERLRTSQDSGLAYM